MFCVIGRKSENGELGSISRGTGHSRSERKNAKKKERRGNRKKGKEAKDLQNMIK